MYWPKWMKMYGWMLRAIQGIFIGLLVIWSFSFTWNVWLEIEQLVGFMGIVRGAHTDKLKNKEFGNGQNIDWLLIHLHPLHVLGYSVKVSHIKDAFPGITSSNNISIHHHHQSLVLTMLGSAIRILFLHFNLSWAKSSDKLHFSYIFLLPPSMSSLAYPFPLVGHQPS